MLRAMVFQNFVHFKDRHVLYFNDPSKNSEGSMKSDPINCLNLFVGANFCGKSVVLELIRRCMTNEINVSLTSSFDENSIAYVFCKFQFLGSKHVISGIIKEPHQQEFHKVLIYTDDCRTTLRSISFSTLDKTDIWKKIDERFHEIHDETDKNALESLFKKTMGVVDVQHVLSKIKCKPILKDRMPSELNWDHLERQYVATMPLRGIGTVQWTKSEKIGKEYKVINYRAATEQAEIISSLLTSEAVDKVKEEKMFSYLTNPQKFVFEKRDTAEGAMIDVRQGESPSFPLLKLSDGILEAKQVALLLAHKEFNTICLEEPDRGMHPQLIERLKEVLYQESFSKTIIVSTHSPYFIDTITIRGTHVFFRKDSSCSSIVCGIKNVGVSKELSRVSDLETYRNLLFATKVLLVEGSTDREVLQILFAQLRDSETGHRREVQEPVFKKAKHPDITNYQIIPVGSCENAKKIMTFCKFICLPCLCLLDRDKFVKISKDLVVSDIVGIDDKDLEMFRKKFVDQTESDFTKKGYEELSSYLQSRYKVFIWKHGALEDAILSSDHLNASIAVSLKLTNIDKAIGKEERNKILKRKLKDRLDQEERKKFGEILEQVEDFKEFLTFLKTNTH